LAIICCGRGEGFGGEKEVGGLRGRGRRKAGGVPGIAGKTSEWLVVATVAEARWTNWPKW